MADSLFSVKDRVVVVTGASGAMGGAAAAALAQRGAKLLLAGSSDSLREVAEACRAFGNPVETVARRPASEPDADAIVDAALAAYGRVDGAVLAAGTNDVDPIETLSAERWQAVMDANVFGSWLVCRALGKCFAAQDQGGTSDEVPTANNGHAARGPRSKVVLVSSTRGKLGHPAGYSAYCTSKAAIDGLTRALACEWGPRGINVNAIAPTVFRSNLTAWMFGEEERGTKTRQNMLARIPLGRLGEPEDLVGATVFLLSAASDFMTGQTLYVDGGYTAG